MATIEAETIPIAQEIFEDVKFRNWVNEVGLVVPIEGIEGLKLKLKSGQHLTEVEEGIADVITTNGNKGHIISWKELTGGMVSKDPAHLVSANLSRVRGKIEDRSLITSIPKIGYGVGIKYHIFKPAETARLTYILWQHFDEEVSSNYLAEILYQQDSSSILQKEHHLAVAVSRLKNALRQAQIRIVRKTWFTRLTWV